MLFTHNVFAPTPQEAGISRSMNTQPNSAPLGKIPLETLVQILCSLRPQDILAIRQCSKTLSAASRERAVWVAALQNVSYEYGVFAGTFPVNTMTLNELEYASTSPDRFLNFLWNNLEASDGLDTISIRVLKPQPGHPFYFMFLVPGGRFLFTLKRGDNETAVELWDLGVSSGAWIRDRPVASLKDSAINPEEQILVQPTDDGEGLLVVVFFDRDGQFFANVYRILPGSACPEFQRIASFPWMVDTAVAIVFTLDFLAFVDQGDVVIWNYREDTWCKYRPHCQAISGIDIYEGNLVIFSLQAIQVHVLPLLEPLVPGLDDVSAHTPHVPNLQAVWSFHNIQHTTPGTWQASSITCSNSPHTPYVSIIGDEAGHGRTLKRYHLRTIPQYGNRQGKAIETLLPTIMPVLIDSINGDGMICDNFQWKLFHLADESQLVCWMRRDKIQARLLSLPHDTQRQEPGVEIRMGALLDVFSVFRASRMVDEYSLCPMSGRLVLRVGGGLTVVDFVRPRS